MDKPWLELDPNDFKSRWWNMSDIVDDEDAKINKKIEDIECYFIIQDCNIGGIYFRIFKWYKNSKNRFFSIICENQWEFNKKLINIFDGDYIYLLENPDIKFKANKCRYIKDLYSDKFVKILERI